VSSRHRRIIIRLGGHRFISHPRAPPPAAARRSCSYSFGRGRSQSVLFSLSLAAASDRAAERDDALRIARRHGQPADTSRDYEYTNREEIARIADSTMRRIAIERARRAA